MTGAGSAALGGEGASGTGAAAGASAGAAGTAGTGDVTGAGAAYDSEQKTGTRIALISNLNQCIYQCKY